MRVGIIHSEILVVKELNEIVSVVHTSEGLVWQGANAQVDHHRSVSLNESLLNVVNIVRKLSCVPQNEGPRLSLVAECGRHQIILSLFVSNPHHLLANRDSLLGHGSQGPDQSQVANVSEGVAALLS